MMVTVGQVVRAWDDLKKIPALEGLDAKTAYWFAKNLRQVEKIMNGYEKARIKTVEKYGTKDDKGMITVGDDRLAEFQKEMGELLDQTEEIKGKFKIPGSAKGLTPNDMMRLEEFVEVV